MIDQKKDLNKMEKITWNSLSFIQVIIKVITVEYQLLWPKASIDSVVSVSFNTSIVFHSHLTTKWYILQKNKPLLNKQKNYSSEQNHTYNCLDHLNKLNDG